MQNAATFDGTEGNQVQPIGVIKTLTAHPVLLARVVQVDGCVYTFRNVGGHPMSQGSATSEPRNAAMNRKTLCVAVFLAASFWPVGCGSGTGTVTVGPPASITTSSGTPQSATINTPFGVPLVALVSDSHGNPVSGVVVTFTAPSSGPSATFASGVNTASTDVSGLATSPIVSANGTIGGPYTVTATVMGVATPANFSLTNTAGTPASITATSGTPQSTAINTAFAAPLVAQVLDNKGNPVSGVTVTFTPPSSGASVTFAGGVNTATTTASGVATSPVVSANATAGGPYTVTATVKGVVAPANFSLTNTPSAAAKENFVFYASGREANSDSYSIAGVFTLNTTNGEVTAGEQDDNDGESIASPQPGGDTITGGSLTIDAKTGNAMLVLITNNARVGQGGRETFRVQWVNANHALLIQEDGTAASSGSMDRQTLPSALGAPVGAFAFLVSGVDTAFREIASGGVFKLTSNGDGTSALSGTIDTNDAGSRVRGTPFTATLSAPNSLGRGTVTNNTALALGREIDYYIVGPEVIRLIDVDRINSGVGSAYGQGAGSFGNTSLLGSSVFDVAGDSGSSIHYAAVGSFRTSNTSSDPADFVGVGDIDENGAVQGGLPGSPISGSYTINSSGYGSLSITNENKAKNPGLGDVSLLGIYMVDPHLNINDPNNTTGGTGGALVVDLGGDGVTVGTGVLLPQTDTSAGSFAGSYALRGQSFSRPGAFSFLLGQGSVTGQALSGTGTMADLSLAYGGGGTDRDVSFMGTAIPDGVSPGRYAMARPTPLTITISGGEPMDFTVFVYQANGGQLFWVNEDEAHLWLGSLELQARAPSFPDVKATASQAPN
jgi:hypothetical protein